MVQKGPPVHFSDQSASVKEALKFSVLERVGKGKTLFWLFLIWNIPHQFLSRTQQKEATSPMFRSAAPLGTCYSGPGPIDGQAEPVMHSWGEVRGQNKKVNPVSGSKAKCKETHLPGTRNYICGIIM